MAAVPKGTIQFEEYFKCRRRIKKIYKKQKAGRDLLTSRWPVWLIVCHPEWGKEKEGVFRPTLLSTSQTEAQKQIICEKYPNWRVRRLSSVATSFVGCSGFKVTFNLSLLPLQLSIFATNRIQLSCSFSAAMSSVKLLSQYQWRYFQKEIHEKILKMVR